MLCKKEACTGCAACYNACPFDCISMERDKEGFLYPIIDSDNCKHCGICKEVCPSVNLIKINEQPQPDVYVCWNNDGDIRKSSSSGGVFFSIAQAIIRSGGVVFGAVYNNNFKVVHDIAKTEDECKRFFGSKYVQSEIGDCYRQVQNYLKQGKYVLFSGTPCQVAGLYAFLKNDDQNLVTCDFSCHGVPSPGVFADYLGCQEKKYKSAIKYCSFREKREGTTQSLLIKFTSGKEYWKASNDDEFYRGFLSDILLRKSCYQCIYASVPRGSDITLGDFHGLEQVDKKYQGNEPKGVSLVLVNSMKGKNLFEEIEDKLFMEKRSLDEATKYNIPLVHPFSEPIKRKTFFEIYIEKGYSRARKVICLSFKNRVGRLLGPQIVGLIKKLANIKN